jgi:hypothetical protein
VSTKPIHGTPVDPQDVTWLELMQEARKESVKSLGEAAKQIIGVAPILSGLYAAALSFAKILPTYWQQNPSARYIFVAPILLWLISLIAAVASIFPQAYTYNPHSPEEAQNAYHEIVSTKHRWLKVAMVFLILSIVALLFAVWTYLGVLASGQVVMKE